MWRLSGYFWYLTDGSSEGCNIVPKKPALLLTIDSLGRRPGQQ